PQAPVVMFALEWCEFCWSVRRLFERLEVPCRVVSVDSVEFQAGDRGGRIRAVLRRRTGAPTIPQVFIGGKLVGGCTDVFDAFKTGELQAQLAAAGVPLRDAGEFDPYALLPGWLHAR
ncbi:MAG TPA: glutaredoxin domain-containing protein, partial [Gammaproteobacteria bacterium]|nr:glutaredoxin domain-containing protein [Gammaproteobacteria bacterium]